MSTLNQVGATVSHSEQDVSNLNAKPSRSSTEEHQEYLYQGCTKFVVTIWAATWQNQQSDCVPSEDSDQPGHPPSLIRVFTVRLMGS